MAYHGLGEQVVQSILLSVLKQY